MSFEKGIIDFYKFLKISHNSSDDDIRRSYKQLALKYHPDKNNGVENENFKTLIEAYETLKDPARRIEYDYKLAAAREPSRPANPKPAHGRSYRPKWEMPFSHDPMGSFSSRLFREFTAGTSFADLFNEGHPSSRHRQAKRRPFAEYDRDEFNRAKRDYDNFETYGHGAKGPPSSSFDDFTRNHHQSSPRYPFNSTTNENAGYRRPRNESSSEFPQSNAEWMHYTFVSPDNGTPNVKSFTFKRKTQDTPSAKPAFSDNYDTNEDQKSTSETFKRHFSSSSNYQRAWGNAFQSYQDADNSQSEPEPNETDHIYANEEDQSSGQKMSTPEIIDLTSDVDENGDVDKENPDIEIVEKREEQQTRTGKIGRKYEQASSQAYEQSPRPTADESSNQQFSETSDQPYEEMKSSFMNVPPFTQTSGNFNMSSISQELGGSKRSAAETDSDDITASPNKKLKPATLFTPVNTTNSRLNARIAELLRKEEENHRALDGLDFHDSDAILSVEPPKTPIFDRSINIEAARAKFTSDMHSYMKQWNEYEYLVTTFRKERYEADQMCALKSLESVESIQRYQSAIRKDVLVNAQWELACNMHYQALESAIQALNIQ